MSPIFTAEGMRSLRTSWVLLVLSIASAAAIVLGSHWFLAREKREAVDAERKLQEARGRLEGARRERDSLQESADVFRTLVERGLLQGERRLDLVEMVGALRARHELFSLDYEVAPQRPLQLPGGRVYPAVDVLASRVRVRMRALHEGDVVGFVEDLGQSRQGFYPLDRCLMRRVEVATADALQPRVEAECAFEWITLKDKNAGRAG
ncbi:MAG TPA: hypothetical protein VFD95_06780 [Usitatibacter sp.]|jgi:hypothetical protein|nr:hypothetical protein [Usitatibacter sp.]